MRAEPGVRTMCAPHAIFLLLETVSPGHGLAGCFHAGRHLKKIAPPGAVRLSVTVHNLDRRLPDEALEAMRDLVRMRAQVTKDLRKTRHRAI